MERIGPYRVEKRIAGGGFGEVYLGRDDARGIEVAIKVFNPKPENVEGVTQQRGTTQADTYDHLKQRFEQEARLLQDLRSNPYIVDVLEVGVAEDGTPYYSMPFLPESLTRRIRRDVTDAATLASMPDEQKPRSLPLNEALPILKQLLEGLSAAHEKGLVHRDLKPSNIMLTETGDVRIVDFGIAKAPDSQYSTVASGGMGSRNYMSPEQRDSAKNVDATADVFSFGKIAYRVLTGRLPEGRFPDPDVYARNLSKGINDLIVECLQQDRELRPQNAQAVLARFHPIDVGEEDLDDSTGTWISGGESSLRDELKQLRNRIESLMLEHGSIPEAERATLETLGAIADLDSTGLDSLVESVHQANKAAIDRIGNFKEQILLRAKPDMEEFERRALHLGGKQIGWSEEKVNALIQERLDEIAPPPPEPEPEPASAPEESFDSIIEEDTEVPIEPPSPWVNETSETLWDRIAHQYRNHGSIPNAAKAELQEIADYLGYDLQTYIQEVINHVDEYDRLEREAAQVKEFEAEKDNRSAAQKETFYHPGSADAASLPIPAKFSTFFRYLLYAPVPENTEVGWLRRLWVALTWGGAIAVFSLYFTWSEYGDETTGHIVASIAILCVAPLGVLYLMIKDGEWDALLIFIMMAVGWFLAWVGASSYWESQKIPDDWPLYLGSLVMAQLSLRTLLHYNWSTPGRAVSVQLLVVGGLFFSPLLLDSEFNFGQDIADSINSSDISEEEQTALNKGVQRLLLDLGYEIGAVDGLIGPRTIQAIKQFQRSEGEKETGVVDHQLATILTRAKRKLEEDAAWQQAKNTNTMAGYRSFAARAGASASDKTRAAAQIEELWRQRAINDCDSCPQMLRIPKGNFQMGFENGDADEKPVHQVNITKDFLMSRTEVTRAQYRVFVEESGYSPADAATCRGILLKKGSSGPEPLEMNWRNAHIRGTGEVAFSPISQTANHPVICVSWQDAMAYVRHLSKKTGKNYRLPSEAEWEYAALASTGKQIPWVDPMDQCKFGNVGDRTPFPGNRYWTTLAQCKDGNNFTAPVGSYPRNEFGLQDLIGNVSEWTADDALLYSPGQRTAAARTSDYSTKVARGGNWFQDNLDQRAARRQFRSKDHRSVLVGFRIARDL